MKSCFKCLIPGLVLCLLSCSKEINSDPDSDLREASELTQTLNSYIFDYMNEGYLWNEHIPHNIPIKYQYDAKQFFDTLLYKPADRWSYITDESSALFRSYSGVETTFGYNPAFFLLSNNTDVIAVVRFVYPGSPAEQAGLKRGDLIVKCNGGGINMGNYTDLVYANALTLELGYMDDNGKVRLNNRKVQLKATDMYLDPVNAWKVIERGEHRIGYLCYTDFVTESHGKLDEVFAGFKAAGVNDVVLDLRYNPGGASLSPPYLASFIAPAAAVSGKSLFLSEEWNDTYMTYWATIGEDRSQYFHEDIAVNLDLNRVFILTTEGTASASEAVISGLTPYMEVVKIGSTTHGKYCGTALLNFRDAYGELEQGIENWAMSLVVFKFVNRDGFTEFSDGIVPDHTVRDDLFNTYPLGDLGDLHLAKAIELITAQRPPVVAAAKTRNAPAGYTLLPIEHARRYPLYGSMVDLLDNRPL